MLGSVSDSAKHVQEVKTRCWGASNFNACCRWYYEYTGKYLHALGPFIHRLGMLPNSAERKPLGLSRLSNGCGESQAHFDLTFVKTHPPLQNLRMDS